MKSYAELAREHSDARRVYNDALKELYQTHTDRQRERAGKRLDVAALVLTLAKEAYDAEYDRLHGVTP